MGHEIGVRFALNFLIEFFSFLQRVGYQQILNHYKNLSSKMTNINGREMGNMLVYLNITNVVLLNIYMETKKMFMKFVTHENLLLITKRVFGKTIEIVLYDINEFVFAISRTRTQHVPVTVVPTVQADKGLWGGEGVLIGYEDGVVKDDY